MIIFQLRNVVIMFVRIPWAHPLTQDNPDEQSANNTSAPMVLIQPLSIPTLDAPMLVILILLMIAMGGLTVRARRKR